MLPKKLINYSHYACQKKVPILMELIDDMLIVFTHIARVTLLALK